MVKTVTDIDIDFGSRDNILEIIPYINASRLDGSSLVKHNVGIYLQDIPTDPITGLSSIPYKEAEERGYFKFDFLNVRAYGLDQIRDEEHLLKLIDQEPDWNMFRYQDITNMLFQVSGDENFRLLNLVHPKSIEQLAMTLAMQRPGKRYLIGKSWKEIEKEIWDATDDDSYVFKRSHATAYAIAIVVQMNLLAEQANVS